MREIYWLAFTLALVPILTQLVAVIFFMVGITRLSRNGRAGTKRAPRPLWPFFTFALFAFVISIWQSVRIDFLYEFWNYSSEAEYVEIVGVSIPVELGENVNNFVDAAFSLLTNLGIIGFYVGIFAYTPWRKAIIANTSLKGRTWVLISLLIAGFSFLAWTTWQSLPSQIADLRALS